MKKILRLILALVAITVTGFSQATMTIQSPGACWNPQSPNHVTVSVSSGTAATSYSFVSTGPSCTDTLVTVSGSVAVFQLQCCGMHTVTCQVYNGSTLCCTATGTVMAVCPPTVTAVASSTVLCLGSTANLAASGATSYVWSNSVNGPTTIVSPTVNTCYTVVGTDSQGCVDAAVVCVMVMQSPTISITNPSPVICQGSGGVMLTAFGGMSYTWVPTSTMSSSVFVFPFSNTCYTVYGSNGTCIGSASTCFTVLPAPTLLAANYFTVCMGSSITLTAATAATYTWHTTPPVLTPTINVLPTAPTMYTVSGTGSNGCSRTETLVLSPNSACAIVWPGDANSDGVVDAADVIELGLYSSSTGAARTPGGNAYTGQFASAWTGTGSNSQNIAHVDCNGDGTVDAGDTLAIFNNFALAHTFRTGNSQAGDDVWLSGPSYMPNNTGNWYKVDIGMGSATNTIQNIYGVTFDLKYESSYVDNNQVYVLYPSSFLDANNTNIPFRRVDAGSSLVNCVSVRTDGNTVSGQGKIGEFWFYNKALTPAGTMTVSIDNVVVYDNSGNPTSLTGASASIPTGPVSLQEATNAHIVAFPNPAQEQLTLRSAAGVRTNYSISDIAGRVLVTGAFTGEARLDISTFAAGTYFIAISSGDSTVSKRLVKD